MSMPYEIWNTLLLLAVGCVLYLLRVRDRNNYSEAIAGVLSIIFFIVNGLALIGGIIAENGTVTYQSTGVGWIFIAMGIIAGLFTFVKILDIVTTRKNEKDKHIDMSPVRL